jgi:hypothetical protein
MRRRAVSGALGIVRAIAPAVMVLVFAATVYAAPLDGTLGRGLHLLMVEQAGCAFCQRWHDEVGVAYGKTSEGRFAPLVRMSITERRGEGLGPVSYTPTFLLVRDGREVGRITGYISEDFFWGLLDPLLQEQGYGPAAPPVASKI